MSIKFDVCGYTYTHKKTTECARIIGDVNDKQNTFFGFCLLYTALISYLYRNSERAIIYTRAMNMIIIRSGRK